MFSQMNKRAIQPMKKQPNNSNCAFALQITLSVTLLCVSLILFALISRAAPEDFRSQGVVMSQGELTSFTARGNGQEVLPDFVNARAMPLPLATGPIDMVPSLRDLGTPGFSPGAVGNGQTNPITLPLPKISDHDRDMEVPEPEEFGTIHQPFSTARADLNTAATNTQYPYRPTGLLRFQAPPPDNTWYTCSASLVKRGVVVTAAHCVVEYGHSTYNRNFHFIPGYRNGTAPFGDWTVSRVWVKPAWLSGTDNCFEYGVVCPDDVAVLLLNPQNGAYVGTQTGWYAYGVNGFGFVNGLTHITQLGYTTVLDHNQLMERNDSRGFVLAESSSNTLIGSLMRDGSDGGPWLINFGIRPALTGQSNGTASNPNMVVGVTSWVVANASAKQMGASPFTSNNISQLVTMACNSQPAACQP
jgi:hypothetical protein